MNDTVSDPSPADEQPRLDATTGQARIPHKGLLVAAVALAALAALGAWIYGYQWRAPAVTSLALLLSFTAVTSWLGLDAARIRNRLNTAPDSESAYPNSQGEQESPQALTEEADRAALDEARSMHFIFLTVPVAVIAFFGGFQLWQRSVQAAATITPSQAMTVGVLLAAVSCVWLVLARAFDSLPPEESPEGAALAQAFREAQWSSLLIAGAVLVSQIWPAATTWTSTLLIVWILVVCLEQLVRVSLVWFLPSTERAGFVSPLRLLLREVFLIRGNPITSILDTIEDRLGLSYRSSWAIRFVVRSTPPLALLLIVLCWALTCLSVVDTTQLGVRENFGRAVGEPLQPGLHVTPPWPFGRVRRYPVQAVQTMQIGFVEEQPSTSGDRRRERRPLLWTQPHDQEFELVTGDGNELVAVNALVYYKIHEDPDRFRDYVFQFQNPAEALEVYAYRSLMELTRSSTLAEVLSTNRVRFAEQLARSLRDYAESNRLGLDVLDVAIVNLHPPVKVASDYLDVASAKLDATRYEIEARGEHAAEKHQAIAEKDALVFRQRQDKADRVARAAEQFAHFNGVGEAFSLETVRLRFWLETLEETFRQARQPPKNISGGPFPKTGRRRNLILYDKSLQPWYGGGNPLDDSPSGANAGPVGPTSKKSKSNP